MTDKEEMGRRKFLTRLTATTVVVAGGTFAAVSGGFLYPVPKKKPKPTFICLESEIPDTAPLEITDMQGRKVLLLKSDKGEILAIGTVCTHLGCTVFYRPKEKFFDCPCHQGKFDGEGNVVSGPAQRPLDRYPVEVRERKVFVQFS